MIISPVPPHCTLNLAQHIVKHVMSKKSEIRIFVFHSKMSEQDDNCEQAVRLGALSVDHQSKQEVAQSRSLMQSHPHLEIFTYLTTVLLSSCMSCASLTFFHSKTQCSCL